MMISTKGRYALRIMADVAQHDGEMPVSVREIAQRQDISGKYMEQIISVLTRSGLLRSIRGAQGGYVLAKAPEEISVGDILRALEGDLTPVACTAIHGVAGNCKSEHTCVTKYVWQQIDDSINQTVNHIFLDELVAESREKQIDPKEKQNCPI